MGLRIMVYVRGVVSLVSMMVWVISLFKNKDDEKGRGFGLGGGYARYVCRDACKDDELVWLPAVRMPRAAARLVLKIDGVCIDADADGRAVWQLEVEVQRA